MKSPFGIVGSETAFQLIYTHFVETGRFTLEQVINWLAVKPAEIFGLNAGTLTVGAPADVAVLILHKLARSIKKTFYQRGEYTFYRLESKRRNTNDFCQRKTCVAEGRIKVWNVCLY